jgi:flagellar assembly protein FliH
MSPQPFTFSRSFPSNAGRMVPLEKPEPMVTVSAHEDALAAAIMQARQEGFVTGQAEARSEEAARLATALESVSMALSLLKDEFDALQAQASQEAIGFAQLLAERVAGDVLDSRHLDLIAATAKIIFPDLRGQPHVAVRVAPELVDGARDKVGAIARDHGFEGRLIVIGEPETPPGDVRIEWAQGGIVRDRAAAAEAVAAAIRRAEATT